MDMSPTSAPETNSSSIATDGLMSNKLIYHVSEDQRKALLSSEPKEYQSAFDSLITEIRDTFDKEGVVLIRGLLEEDLLERLCNEGQAIAEAVKTGNTFTSLQFGPIFSFSDEPSANNSNNNGKVFRETALTSPVPAFVARVLLRLEDKHEQTSHNIQLTSPTTLRMLKDAFLAKGKEPNYCGWHVDDAGFWPVDAQSDNGINVWIALDDIPAQYGGGLAVSPKSHKAEWRNDAYQAIGSTKIFPPEGLEVGSKLFQEVFGKTCSMDSLDPELNNRIEATKEVFDYKKGDCLFCTRWLFHRSMPINEEGLKHYSQVRPGKEDFSLKRYTIRYELGSARTLRGMSLEPCALLYPKNTAGESLDTICDSKGPFYPKCWPKPSDAKAQEAEIKDLVANVLPKAEARRAEVLASMQGSYSRK